MVCSNGLECLICWHFEAWEILHEKVVSKPLFNLSQKSIRKLATSAFKDCDWIRVLVATLRVGFCGEKVTEIACHRLHGASQKCPYTCPPFYGDKISLRVTVGARILILLFLQYTTLLTTYVLAQKQKKNLYVFVCYKLSSLIFSSITTTLALMTPSLLKAKAHLTQMSPSNIFTPYWVWLESLSFLGQLLISTITGTNLEK